MGDAIVIAIGIVAASIALTRLMTMREMKRIRSQLPESMQHCTIVLKECEHGHKWLTATNWVDFGCPTCDLQEIKDELSLYGLVKDKTCLTINTDVHVESTVCACRRRECDGKLVRDADPECELCKGSGYMLIRTTNTRAQRIQQ